MIGIRPTVRPSWIPKYVPRAGDGCVLYLPGQDDPQSAIIRDRSGNGYDAAITGATWTRHGKGLWHLSMDGDDYLSITTPANLAFTTEDFSIVARVYFDNLTADSALVEQATWNVKGYFLQVGLDQKIYLYTIQAGVSQSTSSTASVTTGAWHTLGISRTGASVKTFYEGADITSSAGTHIDPVSAADVDFTIGYSVALAGRYLNGDLALLTVFRGKSLTAVEQNDWHKYFVRLVQ